ncbi:tetratricopeptide repeat-containing diguanylate cyclase [Permianibacter aggregans]|uniref:diguanylate cyclase n=1 Tax=Permianibacter aggregans TaxID=1510150 RepID=A0A4R6UJ75_9GAMM|nr:diguanylate cyclase [Permianibacter aggregans]QGX39626.1 diguanylate cyclase [Permianibacter aggregans]TDQ45469.1 diguanylate cyclase (GGDEF)-like protein [Permianibacter aggregans]
MLNAVVRLPGLFAGLLSRFLVIGLLVFVGLADAAETDPKLESALDDYLLQLEEDPKQAYQTIKAMAERVDADTPLGSRTRFISYLSGAHLHNQQKEQAIALNQQIFDWASESGDPDVWAEGLATQIERLMFDNERKAALERVEQLLTYLPKAESLRVRYFGHNTAAYVYARASRFAEALQQYQLALEVVNQTDDQRTPIRRLYLKSQLASMYSTMKNYSLSLSLSDEAINEAKERELHGFLPDLYILRGYVLVEMGKLGDAIAANEQGLAWADKQGYNGARLTLLNNIGDIHMRENRLGEARQYFERALTDALKLDDHHTENLLRFNLGYIQVKSGLHRQGLEWMKQALQYFRELELDTDVELMLGELADAYHLAGEFAQEATTRQEQYQLSKKIFQRERDKRTTELQEQFAAKEKARQIQLLEQENALKQTDLENKKLQQRIALLLIAVGLLASILIFQLYRKARDSNLRLREANAKLAYQSLRDPLTGLFNRRSFQEQMQHRSHAIERRHSSTTAIDGLILFDVDHFKHINDHYGHAAGDAVLVELSERLMKISRTDDMVMRWGGEEFLMLLRHVDSNSLTMLCQRVLNAIGEKPVEFQGHTIRVTVSAGFLTLPFSGMSEQEFNWEKAVQLADMALYLGKVHGRNRAYGLLHLKTPYEQIRHTLETDLSKAIDNDWVEVTVINGPAANG